MKIQLVTGGLAAGVCLLSAPAFAQENAKALQDAFIAAVAAEDAAGLAALYTDDAMSFSPDGGVAKGKSEIAAAWSPFFEAFDNITMSLEQHGETAISKKSHAAWGMWTMTATDIATGDVVTMKGRFTDVSLKTKSGWKYQNDHASPVGPAPDSQSATAGELAGEAVPAADAKSD